MRERDREINEPRLQIATHMADLEERSLTKIPFLDMVEEGRGRRSEGLRAFRTEVTTPDIPHCHPAWDQGA